MVLMTPLMLPLMPIGRPTALSVGVIRLRTVKDWPDIVETSFWKVTELPCDRKSIASPAWAPALVSFGCQSMICGVGDVIVTILPLAVKLPLLVTDALKPAML